MAKVLNETTVQNELHGASAFFRPDPALAKTTARPRAIDGDRQTRVRKKRPAQKPASPPKIVAEMPQHSAVDPAVNRPIDPPVDQPVDQGTRRAADQPHNQPSDPSADPTHGQSREQEPDPVVDESFDTSAVLPKPKAFYITARQDEDFNILVKQLTARLKGKVGQKIDRSVAARLILEHADLTSEGTVEELAALMIRRLTKQLTSQPTG